MQSRAGQLRSLGQSVWLDFIRRSHLESGEFDRMVRDSGVVGVTSNPTIFQQAISGSQDYDAALERGVSGGLSGDELYDALTIDDIQMACDRLRKVYDNTGGIDGRVSIEVSPRFAHDTRATTDEGLRLHRLVDRPNVMIKVPATTEGIPAITTLIGGGICVNVTLIFSLARYGQVINAYFKGLERLAAAEKPLEPVISVASFFVSRVDSKVDAAIDAAGAARSGLERAELEAFRGKAAIANAKLAYERFRKAFSSSRFAALRTRGARVQRPLWASTSTKNPAYSDTLYVDELIGRDTVNTMPPQTLEAFNDHGTVANTIVRDVEGAQQLFERLPALGVPLEHLIDELEAEGVAAFAKSYDTLLEALEARRRELAGR
jgi:transaldolase